MESEEEKAEDSDPEKEEDVGITFVARKVETPKQRPKSGTCMFQLGIKCQSGRFLISWLSLDSLA